MLTPTPMTVDEMIEILLAYKNNAVIEFIYLDSEKDDWQITTEPEWNFAVCRYRVKAKKAEKTYYKLSELPYPLFVFDLNTQESHIVLKRSDWTEVFSYDKNATFTPYTASKVGLFWSADGKNWKSFVKD